MLGKSGDLGKTVSVAIYADFPSIAVFDVEYTNQGTTPFKIRGWTNHQYSLTSLPAARGPAFWSYQSGSYEKRPNWVVPLRAGFHQDNFLGMNASDYGGGTPIVDVWRKDVWPCSTVTSNLARALIIPSRFPAGRAPCSRSRALESRPNFGTGRKLPYSAHICLSASGGLLPHACGISAAYGAAGI